MPKFVFQLEAVLRHRKTLEEQRQRELGQARAVMAQMEAELRAMDQTTKSVSDDLRDNRLTGTLDMAFLAAHRRYVLAMQRKAMGVVQQMAQLQAKVDEAQKALQAAAVQRKIMEKLKEKQQSRWKEELDRKELAQQDEIAMQMSYANHVEDLEGQS
jgi:flagellar FliJ protein